MKKESTKINITTVVARAFAGSIIKAIVAARKEKSKVLLKQIHGSGDYKAVIEYGKKISALSAERTKLLNKLSKSVCGLTVNVHGDGNVNARVTLSGIPDVQDLKDEIIIMSATTGNTIQQIETALIKKYQ